MANSVLINFGHVRLRHRGIWKLAKAASSWPVDMAFQGRLKRLTQACEPWLTRWAKFFKSLLRTFLGAKKTSQCKIPFRFFCRRASIVVFAFDADLEQLSRKLWKYFLHFSILSLSEKQRTWSKVLSWHYKCISWGWGWVLSKFTFRLAILSRKLIQKFDEKQGKLLLCPTLWSYIASVRIWDIGCD